RTVGDYRHLRTLATEGARIVVVGGGYIGSEIAAGLTRTGARVTLAHDGRHLLEHMFPASLTAHLEQTFAEHGVTVVPGFRLMGIGTDEELVVHAGAADSLRADAVVLGLGADPNTTLAAPARLALHRGPLVVHPYLRPTPPDAYPAGGTAVPARRWLGLRHVEHVDHAQASGAAAGENMAGAEEAYEHTPMFFSDLFDDGYEAVGRLDSSLEMREVWNEDRTAAVVHYLEDGAVEGVLLWNTWDSVEQARELITASQNGEVTADELDGRIPPG